MVEASKALGDAEILDLLKRAFVFARPEDESVAEKINLESSVDELGIQSVAALEMAGFIEEELDVQFADEDLVSIRQMNDLARMIREASA